MLIKFIAGAVYLLIAFLFVIYTTPQSPAVVIAFVLLVSLGIIQLASILFNRKYSRLIGLFSALFLLLNAFVGFNALNTLLLLSFFVGLEIMLK